MNLDLNLLRVFDVMLEERSVTRAGTRLGLTQSAVSHALNRLRYALSDELFVRGPSGMQPTPRALEMGPQVHAALIQLQAAVAPADFAPASSERRFSVVAGTYTCAVLTPPLVSRLSAQAPLAELVMAQYTPDIIDSMDSHRLDFFVAGVLTAPPRFAREVVLTDSLVWVVRADHTMARAPKVDLAGLAAAPHVAIVPNLPGAADDGMGRRGLITRASWEDAGTLDRPLLRLVPVAERGGLGRLSRPGGGRDRERESEQVPAHEGVDRAAPPCA